MGTENLPNLEYYDGEACVDPIQIIDGSKRKRSEDKRDVVKDGIFPSPPDLSAQLHSTALGLYLYSSPCRISGYMLIHLTMASVSIGSPIPTAAPADLLPTVNL